MEGDDGDECAVEVAAFGDGDVAVRLKKEGMDCFEVFVGNGKEEGGGGGGMEGFSELLGENGWEFGHLSLILVFYSTNN